MCFLRFIQRSIEPKRSQELCKPVICQHFGAWLIAATKLGGLGEEGEQSRLLIEAWSNFVKHENPNGVQGNDWPEYKAPLWQHRWGVIWLKDDDNDDDGDDKVNKKYTHHIIHAWNHSELGSTENLVGTGLRSRVCQVSDFRTILVRISSNISL